MKSDMPWWVGCFMCFAVVLIFICTLKIDEMDKRIVFLEQNQVCK